MKTTKRDSKKKQSTGLGIISVKDFNNILFIQREIVSEVVTTRVTTTNMSKLASIVT